MRLFFIILGYLLVLIGIAGILDRAEANEGQRLYKTHCTRCHSPNPWLSGSVGPELITTPYRVFKTKVPEGKYPTDYTPKRRTKIMPKFPGLTNKVDLIYDYIRSFKR
jgi:mono/diheme cytochrome c family protein